MSTKTKFPAKQISTSISDGALAAAAFYVAYSLHGSRLTQCAASLAFALPGLAASIGVIRFSGVTAVIPLHEFLSVLAAQVGVPLTGASFLLQEFHAADKLVYAAIGVLVVGFFAVRFGRVMKLNDYTTLIGGPAILALIIGNILMYTSGIGKQQECLGAVLSGVGGAVGVIVSGLVIGTEGTRQLGPFRMHSVDVFHYALAAAYLALACSFKFLFAST